MAKADLKTKKTEVSVLDFLQSLEDANQRTDCLALCEIMKEVTGHEPKMWGGSIIGFGDYQYSYESGRTGDWFQVGFSPRKGQLSLYLLHCVPVPEHYLSRLGKHKTGKSCLYIKSMKDIDLGVLKEMVAEAVKSL